MGFVRLDQPRETRPRARRPGRFPVGWWRPILPLLVAFAVLAPGAASAATTWSKNLYVARAFLYQDPYPTACTAAAAMMMLNTIAYRGTGGEGFIWEPSRIKRDDDPDNRRDMTSILSFARANDTLRASGRGSDPHGWRNALNAFGWGRDAMLDPALRVYDDRAYRTFNAAVRSAVRAIARREMPVGVLGWAGGHAQVMTGYVVTGANPEVSNDFVVRSVFLSDPLYQSGTVNRRLSLEKFRSGPPRVRFQAYREADSPYDDPWTAGTIKSSVVPSRGKSEWYRRWVLLLPIRDGSAGGPGPDPTPTPGPSEEPSEEPSAEPTPDPTAETTPEPTDEPTPEPTPEEANAPDAAPTPEEAPTPDPTAEPKPDPTAEPKPDPTAEPTPEPTPDPTPDPTVEPSADG